MSTSNGRNLSSQLRDGPSGSPLETWHRGLLAGLLTGIVAVFCIAFWLNPYGDDGKPLRMGTHEQLGFPPCNFVILTGKPCPSCGMTTSFALFVRGDLVNSKQANPVGMLLAGFLILLIPWGLASLWKGRSLFVRSLQVTGLVVLVFFVGLSLLRWGILMALGFRA